MSESNMKYNKERKALAHAKAVENATEYLLTLPLKKKVWDRAIGMFRFSIKLKDHSILPPLDVTRL